LSPIYEVVIHAKGAKSDIVSPTTYDTDVEAAKDLEALHEAMESGGVVRLSWYAGRADNINAAVICETSIERPASSRTSDDVLADLDKLGFVERIS
jgi:hypothetical protein